MGIAARLLLALAGLYAVGLVLAFAPSFYVLATTQDLASIEPAAAEFLVLHDRLWPAWILSFAGIFVFVIILSHRIAGPIYRVNAILRALLEDRDPPVTKFRRNDYFQQTAALLGELSEKMRASRRNAPTPPVNRQDPPAS